MPGIYNNSLPNALVTPPTSNPVYPTPPIPCSMPSTPVPPNIEMTPPVFSQITPPMFNATPPTLTNQSLCMDNCLQANQPYSPIVSIANYAQKVDSYIPDTPPMSNQRQTWSNNPHLTYRHYNDNYPRFVLT